MSDSNKPCIAITGANGFLGSALVDYFLGKNWRVIALSREDKRVIKSKNFSHIKYDLTETKDSDLLQDVDYLVHAAYVKQDRQNPDAYNINVKAAENLFEAAKKNKLKKVVFISSMSAHEAAVSTYGKQKLAIEKVFKAKNCVSIRSGLIIGDGGLVKQMIGFMKSKHLVPLVDGGKQPLQIVSINDLVLAIDKLLQSSVSGVITIATPEVYSYKKLYEAMSKQFKIRVLFIPVPFSVLYNMIRIINFLPIPLAVSPDNALGLKYLRSAETKKDLDKVGLSLKNLEDSLAKMS